MDDDFGDFVFATDSGNLPEEENGSRIDMDDFIMMSFKKIVEVAIVFDFIAKGIAFKTKAVEVTAKRLNFVFYGAIVLSVGRKKVKDIFITINIFEPL